MANNNNIHIPELSLVVLMGASSSGKSTFARKHFKPTEIISSDQCRALVSDNENSQEASTDAFDVARFIAGKRLKAGLLTVIDATNVQESARKDWIRLAREYHVLPVAIVINMPEKLCVQRHETRPDRDFGKHVIPQQISQLRRSVRHLKLEGFRNIIELRTPEEVDAIEAIIRDPLYNNKKEEHGPFDIIGDVHGCYDELVELILELGYQHTEGIYSHPAGRKLVFVGDLVDRGPKTPEVLDLVMTNVKAGTAFCVPGNHDAKLVKWLKGKDVTIAHGLQESIDQLNKKTPAFREDVKQFLDGLISHYVFDGGNLVVAHAGLREEMHGRGSGAVRDFCMYGETTGEIDEFGLPVRYNWAAEYKGKAMVVYGHTPVPEPQWLNRTIDIDTGCVFGGKLTALRYPEKELMSVPSQREYAVSKRPLHKKEGQLSLQQQHDDVLDIADVTGKHIVETSYGHKITIKEENAITALEVMSRFAINPKWLIYLPPTMSPSETSKLDDYLEYPTEAFEYYRSVGVEKVVCEEKHMGSRAVVIVGRDENAIKQTFGIENEGIGTVYTRTGRHYFTDKKTEQDFLLEVNDALEKSGFYDRFQTSWVCLDTELMPWSAKAQSLLETQYGSVGAAAKQSLHSAVAALQQATTRNEAVFSLLQQYKLKQQQTTQFIEAYCRYCWPVHRLTDYKLAPFHILATEGKTWVDQSHEWHMENIQLICEEAPAVLLSTPYKIVDLNNEASIQDATNWWLSLTAKGGEGMVVKPFDYIHTNKKGLVQPAIKIRGQEYLRIIYGPEYTTPENLNRLKSRGLSTKRSLALREFALGVEGLERFIKKEPLRRVHECVFGVLALESEPVDPRL
ncbi:polynucleotide kinase-phosphatase [Niastella yeongjuensis]|uniref:Polynucleotide kinase-phosphatase n=1 Tax=Niastella yeongjuensis TaxID=354355 RepID=A0A1V9EIP3_9BACT|nr:polynucleotide kinase-phosphatase [Niastella yeongjuensis]OQP46028.1 polynucleotide kinase-phosphatase [Niastella yeongjuensis]SEP18728.1 polynucleotide kinase-phosphatase [Niastella yeongjuensis]